MREPLSKTDTKYFAEFEKRYEGWKVFRMNDGSMIFQYPQRDNLPKKIRWYEKNV